MAARGVDVKQATTQQMRTWVCAQCHIEYYFKGEDKLLTFPWGKGINVDAIAATYDELDFADWTHKLTGTRLIKIQHPEFDSSPPACTRAAASRAPTAICPTGATVASK